MSSIRNRCLIHAQWFRLPSRSRDGITWRNPPVPEVKFGITGAAPIRVDTLEYFGSLGLQINEVYGMSESTAAATVSTTRVHQWGSCGFQLPGMEVKAFKVDSDDINKRTECPRAPQLDSTDESYQGELCFCGRSISDLRPMLLNVSFRFMSFFHSHSGHSYHSFVFFFLVDHV